MRQEQQVFSGLAAWGTVRRYGPYAGNSPHESRVLLQAYTTVMAVMVTVLA